MSRVCVPYYIRSPVLGTTRVVEHYSPWCQSIRKIHSRGDDDRSNRVCSDCVQFSRHCICKTHSVGPCLTSEEGIHMRALRPCSSDLNMYSEWTFNNSVKLNIFRTNSCLGEMNISQRNKFEI